MSLEDRKESQRIMRLVDETCIECDKNDDWTPLDNLLREVDVNSTSIDPMLTWLLTSGWAPKEGVPHRAKLLEKFEEKLEGHPRKDILLAIAHRMDDWRS
jgi:hypothetical protein